MVCFKTLSLIVYFVCAAHRYSQTGSQQRASTYHSPFHPSCPHSRCHGHRPNGQECSADYHNETRSLCTHVELRQNMKTEIKKSQMCHGFLNAVYKFCPYYDIKHPHYIKQFAQLLLCSELMSSLETNSLGISAATRGAVPP